MLRISVPERLSYTGSFGCYERFYGELRRIETGFTIGCYGDSKVWMAGSTLRGGLRAILLSRKMHPPAFWLIEEIYHLVL
ncbi:hypothetical protein WG66_010555 [Moniliophthora roreri]|nr:hypothetical protein WG66_010555 [Moniliophthora roreri]